MVCSSKRSAQEKAFMTGENSMSEKSRIRAVFSDVDGTLLNSAHRVTPRTAEWIRKLGEMDIPFVIVSARSPSGIYPIMKRNGFQSALIAYSGALIMDKDRNILYNRQIITLKPGRWNCFFVMSYSVAGLLILIFSILVVFLNIHLLALLVFAYLMRLLVIIGRIFKIKTTLFKNQRSNTGFILYLCAFELAPILIEFMLTSRLFGLI